MARVARELGLERRVLGLELADLLAQALVLLHELVGELGAALEERLQEGVALLLELCGDVAASGRSLLRGAATLLLRSSRSGYSAAYPSRASWSTHADSSPDDHTRARAQRRDIAAPREQHRGAELGLDAVEERAPLPRVRRRVSARSTGRAMPPAVAPRAMAARRRAPWRRRPSRRSSRTRAARAARRTPPSGRPSPRAPRRARCAPCVARRRGALRLDADPRRAARARDVDVLHADVAEAPADARARCRSPVSLTTTGTPRSRDRGARWSSRPGEKSRSPPGCTSSIAGFRWTHSASAPTSSTSARTSLVVIARACTTPTLPRTSVVGATSRTR